VCDKPFGWIHIHAESVWIQNLIYHAGVLYAAMERPIDSCSPSSTDVAGMRNRSVVMIGESEARKTPGLTITTTGTCVRRGVWLFSQSTAA
jgi:hypothetical protein